MTFPLRIGRVLGDRPFAEVGEPVLAVADDRRGLLAVAGAHGGHLVPLGRAPVGVYDVDDLGRRALVRSHYPVTAMAFHPDLPLLAIGTGCYDGGYFFMGELLLTDLETGRAVSLIDSPLGPQVLALEWLTGQDLRVLVAPPHDGDDAEAWVEGHVAVVSRPDWRLVPPASITWQELAGPRVAAPRPDHREEARRAVSGLSRDWDPRRNVRAVEELSDGRILATLDEVRAESWLPSGQRQWTVADDKGGRDLVVATDERSVWVGLVRPTCEEPPQALVRLSLQDGAQIEHITLSAPASLVCRADGLPALAPAGDLGERGRLRIRRGSRVYFREIDRPGVETTDGSLVYAGTVHHGQGLQPGGSFVVRREIRTGEPRWVFRTDRTATDLDADAQTAYVAYDDGEIVALDLQDGTVRRRRHLTVAAVQAIPTALTVVGPDALLIGTSDGRILKCSAELPADPDVTGT
ncbi:PQQ-binding-like beta-propeller repeat protein [Amorphoplanes digitatis]|uniref:Uncharacterized protein n=1 Tax=Actinoplanes digitatis TaxID=1868 RepID=A0A7W7MRR1_9ACTN|nr:hypothetical protein [Actinoplanes digitatis]MBB4763987.1 hypothetical protein [Actinoplanes digitatis]GID93807.1 hypothetical protein Adi01nite_32190 [Actinoplanes digitatis]